MRPTTWRATSIWSRAPASITLRMALPWGISEGAPQPGTTVLTLFLAGEIAGQNGLYRSTNGGASWIRVDDAANEYGYWNIVQGDPRVFARVCIGTEGRGIIEADSPY